MTEYTNIEHMNGLPAGFIKTAKKLGITYMEEAVHRASQNCAVINAFATGCGVAVEEMKRTFQVLAMNCPRDKMPAPGNQTIPRAPVHRIPPLLGGKRSAPLR